MIDHKEASCQNKSMTVHGIIDFVINHNAILIESLVVLIVLFVIFLAYRGFKTEKSSVTSSLSSTSDLEEALKKVLERANQITPAAQTEGSKGKSEELSATIDELKASLEERQKEIESLKSTTQSSGATSAAPAPGLTQNEKDDLSKKIAELETKLAEYEIISEDIADLSFYKEENAKLQKEISSLKSTKEPTIVGQSKASPPPVVNDDIMKEFAAAVEKPSEEAPPVVDLEKVVSEAANLKEVSGPIENPLEKALDPEKLAAEADSLEKATQVKPDDTQLMDDFQNFLKKDNP